MTKAELRLKILSTIHKISHDELNKKSLQISNILSAYLNTTTFSKIGGFFPTKTEPKWNTNINKKTIAYPALSNGRPSFFVVNDLSSCSYGEFGKNILIPPKDDEVVPDVVIVPGVAFTKDGQRLGRGGGFYDKYLKNFSQTSIGICFSEQIVSTIPCEEHDQKVDMVITDRELLREL